MQCTLSSFTLNRLLGNLGTAQLLSPGMASAQDAPLTDKWVGDVGAAACCTQRVIRSQNTTTSELLYGYIDYGQPFACVDALGVKAVKLGYGYWELVGQASRDGWNADTVALAGLADRKISIPLGIETFQKTRCGTFFSECVGRCQPVARDDAGGHLRGQVHAE